jgi:hypothetical protein
MERFTTVTDGFLSIIFNTASILEGDFEDGERNGLGLLKCPDYSYNGEFRNNVRWGYGASQYPNGDFYEGKQSFQPYFQLTMVSIYDLFILALLAI